MGQTHFDGITVNTLVAVNPATVPAPVAGTDAANKTYVDNAAQGGSLTNANVSSALQTTLALTSAQIKALNGTPLTVIAAPAAGKAIQILGAVLSYVRATASYTNTATGDMALKIGSQEVVTGSEMTAVILNGSSIAKALVPTDNATLTAATALILSKATGEFDGTGTGTAKLIVTYVIVTL